MNASVLETVLLPGSMVVMPNGVWPIDVHNLEYSETLLNRWADEQFVALAIPDDTNSLLPVRHVVLCEIRGGIGDKGKLALSLVGVARAVVTQLGVRGADGLLRATVTLLKDKLEDQPVSGDTKLLVSIERLVKSCHERLGEPWSKLCSDGQDVAHWLSDRLLELLPVESLPLDKLLAENDPLERLRCAISVLDEGQLVGDRELSLIARDL